MKIAASIGATVIVVLILLYTNGYFGKADGSGGRSQFDSTKQAASRSEAEPQQAAREAERQRIAKEEAERQRLGQQEDDRQRLAQEAERQRVAKEEAERQRIEKEKTERERLAKEEERPRVAQENEQRPARAEAEKGQSDDLNNCLQRAEDSYAADWARTCRQIDGPPNCILPPQVMARSDGVRRDARDECARLYPVK